MVTLYEIIQSNATSTPLEIEHLMMQVASCAPDRILILWHEYLYLVVVRLCVRADCTFPPLRKDPMKLLPLSEVFPGQYLILLFTNRIINLLDQWGNVYPFQP